MTLHAARLSATMLWLYSHLACIKTDKETHEMIQNCGLAYSIDREKLHQQIFWQEFVQNIASDQMFISGEMVAIPNNCMATLQ